jgi:hypothetical protein
VPLWYVFRRWRSRRGVQPVGIRASITDGFESGEAGGGGGGDEEHAGAGMEHIVTTDWNGLGAWCFLFATGLDILYMYDIESTWYTPSGIYFFSMLMWLFCGMCFLVGALLDEGGPAGGRAPRLLPRSGLAPPVRSSSAGDAPAPASNDVAGADEAPQGAQQVEWVSMYGGGSGVPDVIEGATFVGVLASAIALLTSYLVIGFSQDERWPHSEM